MYCVNSNPDCSSSEITIHTLPAPHTYGSGTSNVVDNLLQNDLLEKGGKPRGTPSFRPHPPASACAYLLCTSKYKTNSWEKARTKGTNTAVEHCTSLNCLLPQLLGIHDRLQMHMWAPCSATSSFLKDNIGNIRNIQHCRCASKPRLLFYHQSSSITSQLFPAPYSN
jgi:hypothetical protein